MSSPYRSKRFGIVPLNRHYFGLCPLGSGTPSKLSQTQYDAVLRYCSIEYVPSLRGLAHMCGQGGAMFTHTDSRPSVVSISTQISCCMPRSSVKSREGRTACDCVWCHQWMAGSLTCNCTGESPKICLLYTSPSPRD